MSVKFKLFYYLSIETCVLGAQKNRLIETGPLSTHNICFGWEIKKIDFHYTLLSGALIKEYFWLSMVEVSNIYCINTVIWLWCYLFPCRCCTMDGKLLKPSRPATAIDKQIILVSWRAIPNTKHVHQIMNVHIKQTQIMTEIDEFLIKNKSFCVCFGQ